ncbi:protein C3orf33-like isoform X2 [Oratosquilla oratoria]|uniref:protein C3orf33-like isoform X2 n=1 Tax=Oratosquilla oratoria TaxID=337810 RepID=UPI003F772C33
MADDAADPRPDFYKSLHRIVAKFTHVLDDNIRIVQYGIYGVGVAGLLVALHSVRAFTHFGQIGHIPAEFVTKHMRFHGFVRWVDTSPPPLAKATSKPPYLLPPSPSLDQPLPATVVPGEEEGPRKEEGPLLGASPPEAPKGDVSGITSDLTPLMPWEDSSVPEVARIQYSEELKPLYLQIEHSPIFVMPWRKRSQDYLPLQVADIEITGVGARKVKEELHNRRVWFTLLKHDLENDILVCLVRRNKLLRRRSFNEELVRSGEALVAPLDLDLHDDAFYVAFYKRLLDSQTFAEKKKVGLWRPEATDGWWRGGALLTKLWRKLRNRISSRKDVGS